jgi:hypothetical protein
MPFGPSPMRCSESGSMPSWYRTLEWQGPRGHLVEDDSRRSARAPCAPDSHIACEIAEARLRALRSASVAPAIRQASIVASSKSSSITALPSSIMPAMPSQCLPRTALVEACEDLRQSIHLSARFLQVCFERLPQIRRACRLGHVGQGFWSSPVSFGNLRSTT